MNQTLSRITPENLTAPENENQILVGETNLLGKHGAGVALLGKQHWGAKDGREQGLTGQFWGIPTKVNWRDKVGMEPEQIRPYVDKMIAAAQEMQEKIFLVTAIGCGYAGRTPEEMAPLFVAAGEVENIWLPRRFWDVLIKNDPVFIAMQYIKNAE